MCTLRYSSAPVTVPFLGSFEYYLFPLWASIASPSGDAQCLAAAMDDLR